MFLRYCLTVAALTLPLSAPLYAGTCARLAASDVAFGKEASTAAGEAELKRYIADWTKDKGWAHYNIGKISNSCTVYANFIVTTEYRCKAQASVCKK